MTETIPLLVQEAEETESNKCIVYRSKSSAWRIGKENKSRHGITGKEISSNLKDNEFRPR
jgi:hypothetical protein